LIWSAGYGFRKPKIIHKKEKSEEISRFEVLEKSEEIPCFEVTDVLF
jgi:hypothetical protein